MMITATWPHCVTHLTNRICRSLRLEIDLIATLLKEEISSISTPIAELIDCEPTCVSYGDVFLVNCGGWSINLRFWWCIVWPDNILNHNVHSLKNNSSVNLISINILKYLVLVIKYAASQASVTLNPLEDEHPALLNRVNNTSAHTWYTKGFIQTKEWNELS